MGARPPNDVVINGSAPVRVCDFGGWTDTWFAGHGCVLNIAVGPRTRVQVRAITAPPGAGRVCLQAPDLEEDGGLDGEDTHVRGGRLLNAAVQLIGPPADRDVNIWVSGGVPPGSSTGSSAAACVALLGALNRLRNCDAWTSLETAKAAHRVETELLGRQSGIQDQIAAAQGGISFIEIDRYPEVRVSQVRISRPFCWELEARLSLVFVGEAHSSSAVHEMVIRRLESTGYESTELVKLRKLARHAREALINEDLQDFGRTMIQNTEAQAQLHPELVGPRHREIIEVACRSGAWGWKVNGAGGNGGSVTILHGPHLQQITETNRQIAHIDPAVRVIPIHLCDTGLRTWIASAPP